MINGIGYQSMQTNYSNLKTQEKYKKASNNVSANQTISNKATSAEDKLSSKAKASFARIAKASSPAERLNLRSFPPIPLKVVFCVRENQSRYALTDEILYFEYSLRISSAENLKRADSETAEKSIALKSI